MMKGTLTPCSAVPDFPPETSRLSNDPVIARLVPLAVVNTMIVFCRNPFSSIAATIRPTSLSA